MKKVFRWYLVGFLVVALSTVTLAACSRSKNNFFGFGGGGTPTGASTFSRGAVATQDNQQNMSLNGVQFGMGNSNVMINGNSGSAGDLRMGQIVTLRGNANGANGTANTIVFNNDMTGPITSISTGSGTAGSGTSGAGASGVISSVTFTMFGQTVKVDGNTLFQSDDIDITNLQAGSVVEVSGIPDGAGTLIATFINSRPTATQYNVRGLVSNVSGSTFTLTPNGNGNPLTVTLGPGATVTTAQAISGFGTGSASAAGTGAGGTTTGTTGTTTGSGAGGTGSVTTGGTGTTSGTITGGTGTTTGAGGTTSAGTGTTTGTTSGTTAGAGAGGTTGGLANGQFVNVLIDPATFNSGSTTITAKSVIIEPSLLPAEGDMVFLEGFASNATGTSGANTFQIDGITVNAGSNTLPPAGSRVAVHGTFTKGVLNADMVQPAAGSQLTIGSITSITGAGTTTGAGAGGTATTGGTGTTTGTGAGGTGVTTGGTGTTTGTGAGGTAASTAVQQVACAASATTTVTISDFVFTPASVSVPANGIVRWTNNGPSIHTATSDTGMFDSGQIPVGSSVCFQFPTAGSFPYHCTIHPFMTGSVTVTGSAAGTTTGAGAGGTGTAAGTTTGTGTGGTTGTVTMVVNGTTFDISTARIKMNGQQAGIADLQPGKQVIVKAFSNNFASILFPGTSGTAATAGTGAGGTGTTATGAGAGGTGTVSTGGTGTTAAAAGGTTGAAAGGTSGTSGSPLYSTAGGVSSSGTTTGAGAGGTGTSGSTTGAGAGGTVTTTGTGTTAATATGAGAGGRGGVAKAVTVWIIDNIHGPATAMSGSLSSTTSGTTTGSLTSAPTATFTVFSQTIVANGNTRLGRQLQSLMSSSTGSLGGLDALGTNPVIEASGIPDNVGDLIATFLENNPASTEYHVRGIVSSATGSPLSTFTLTPVPNGTPLTVTLASSATVTNVTDGMTVNVRIDPSTFNAGSTTLTAKAVDRVKEPVPAENDLVSVEGIVTGDGTIMTALGIPINASTTGLAVGSRVIVQGSMSNGSLTSSRMSGM